MFDNKNRVRRDANMDAKRTDAQTITVENPNGGLLMAEVTEKMIGDTLHYSARYGSDEILALTLEGLKETLQAYVNTNKLDKKDEKMNTLRKDGTSYVLKANGFEKRFDSETQANLFAKRHNIDLSERTDEYNGWRNRETWNVALWIGNDYGLYQTAVEYAKSTSNPTYRGFVSYAGLSGTTSDGVSWTDGSLDYNALDRDIAEYRNDSSKRTDEFSEGGYTVTVNGTRITISKYGEVIEEFSHNDPARVLDKMQRMGIDGYYQNYYGESLSKFDDGYKTLKQFNKDGFDTLSSLKIELAEAKRLLAEYKADTRMNNALKGKLINEQVQYVNDVKREIANWQTGNTDSTDKKDEARTDAGTYKLVWKGEVIEEGIASIKEAQYLQKEYQMAYRGIVTIVEE